MKRVLFFLPNSPYPPRKNGVSVRYHPLFEYLSKTCDIDLIIISNEHPTDYDIGDLEDLISGHKHIVKDSESKVSIFKKILTRLITALPYTTPLRYIFYQKKRHFKEIKNFTHSKNYDSVVFVTPIYAEYISQLRHVITSKKWVIDSIDSPHLHTKRMIKKSLWAKYQSWKIKIWEAQMIENVDQSIYITETDASATVTIKNKKTPAVIPNGILITDYTAEKLNHINDYSIGFLGNMSYQPNISAVHILHDKIFIPLKNKIPSLSLHIIGRTPIESIKNLAKNDDVHVTGEIESIWPYINAITLFVLPLNIGAGQQNKILEIMYAGRPAIFSKLANIGIGAKNQKECMICDENDIADWIKQTESLIQHPERANKIAQHGKSFISKRYDWDKIKVDYKNLIF